MITFERAYKTGDGQVFSTLDDAKKGELKSLLESEGPEVSESLLKLIITKQSEIVNILTLTPTSHPKGRAASGATRKRKPKLQQVPASQLGQAHNP